MTANCSHNIHKLTLVLFHLSYRLLPIQLSTAHLPRSSAHATAYQPPQCSYIVITSTRWKLAHALSLLSFYGKGDKPRATKCSKLPAIRYPHWERQKRASKNTKVELALRESLHLFWRNLSRREFTYYSRKTAVPLFIGEGNSRVKILVGFESTCSLYTVNDQILVFVKKKVLKYLEFIVSISRISSGSGCT